MLEVATSSGHLAVVEAEGLLHARGIPYATAERITRADRPKRSNSRWYAIARSSLRV